jgi:glycosyltransferase involved in cell wall biosynthesis
MDTRRILFITYHFPPLHSVASLRTYAFARYLGEYGFEVTVLTPEKGSAECRMEMPLDGGAFRVVKVKGPRRAEARQATPGNGWRFRLKKFLAAHVIGNLFTSADSWLVPLRREAMRLADGNSFDIVLSTFSPISTHAVAWSLKGRFPGLMWIADYRDLWSGNNAAPRPLFPLSLLQTAAEHVLNARANLLLTVSLPLRDLLEKRYGRPAAVIENGYLPEDELATGTAPDFTRRFTFSYTGSIYRGRRDPEPFFTALTELFAAGGLERRDVEVRFYGENSYLLEGQVLRHGLQDVVRLLPEVDRQMALAVQRHSVANLFLECDDPASRGNLTGKLFEQLVSGRPILGVGIGEGHAAAQVIIDTSAGYVCGRDVSAIRRAVMEIVGGGAYSPDREKIAVYRRDRLVAKLARIIEESRGRG